MLRPRNAVELPRHAGHQAPFMRGEGILLPRHGGPAQRAIGIEDEQPDAREIGRHAATMKH